MTAMVLMVVGADIPSCGAAPAFVKIVGICEFHCAVAAGQLRVRQKNRGLKCVEGIRDNSIRNAIAASVSGLGLNRLNDSLRLPMFGGNRRNA